MKRSSTFPVALVILALSATAVTASGPVYVGPNRSQPSASQRADATSNEPGEQPEPVEVVEPSGAAPSLGAAPSFAAEPSHPANHGNDVSTAAHSAAPNVSENPAQPVSSVAKDNHGHNKEGTPK